MEINTIINENQVNERLDKIISSVYKLPRGQVQKYIDNKSILLNNKPTKSGYKVKLCDEINGHIIEEASEILPENILLSVVYEDNDLIVINKPKGMVVHPGAGNYSNTLVNGLLYRYNQLSNINGSLRPGIVHRIDKDTSGLLLVCKTNFAHESIARQLKEHSIKRVYKALCYGNIKEAGTVVGDIGRNPHNRLKFAIVKNGKPAITHYEPVESFNNYTFVKCQLETGRTHQIRVHLSSINHPLVGDSIYGYKKDRLKVIGQCLHAETIGFIHPRTKEYMEYSVEPPKYFMDLLNILRKK